MKRAPIVPGPDAPKPVTVELFQSYAEAKAASTETAEHAAAILAITEINGPEQEAWAADRGRELAGARKAAEARLKKWLQPIKEIEATIRGFDMVAGEPTSKLLDRCAKHLAGLLGEARARAAAAQAALLPAATSPEETAAALAVLQPKPSGYVERETWGWEIVDLAKVPHDYFVLDTARLDREAAEHKRNLAVPGIEPKVERKGHFRS